MRRCKPYLGTFVEICAGDAPSSEAAISAAFLEVQEVQRLFNFYDPLTPLSRLNQLRRLAEAEVSAAFSSCLKVARELFELSGGAFMPFVERQGDAWCRSSLDQWPLVVRADCYVIEHPSACLDLGGIAKGFAVDRAFEALARAEVGDISVNAGGDLRLRARQPQSVAIRSPRSPAQILGQVPMSEGALATSCVYPERVDRVGPGELPLACSSAYSSISVMSDTCVLSDGLTKCVWGMGARAEPLLEHFHAKALVTPL